jgi:Tat protein secretion system quality control protein TatD with DNase activity
MVLLVKFFIQNDSIDEAITMKKLFLSLSGLLLTTLSFAQPALWGTPVAPRPESEALAQSVPIADVHMHFNPKGRQTVEQMIQRMQDGNIRWGGAVGDYSGDMQAALGDRYLPAIGQAEFTKVLLSSGEQGLLNLEHPVFVDFFKEAELLMATGKARGFGEIHIDNKTTTNFNDPFGRSIPLESPVVQRMYELANAYKGFIQIHYDKSARTVDQIIAMAQRYPKSLTIVSHCMPKGTPDDMRKIFSSAPNVVCEISGATHIHGIPRIVTPSGINSRWLQMIEDYPDRVMMGTDPCCGLMGRYNEIVQVMRSRALAAMKPETLEKVAYKNALRVFGLPN